MSLSAEHPIEGTATLRAIPGALEVSIAGLAIGLSVFMAWATPDGVIASRAMVVGIGGLVVWIAWQDWRTFTIPDGAVVAIAALAIGYRWSCAMQIGDTPFETVSALTFDALLPAGLLMAFREVYFRRRGFDGLGLGDVKLAVAGALLVGIVAFSWALFAASVTGLVAFGIRRLFSDFAEADGADRIAFGALLAPAFWMVWMAQTMVILMPVAWR